MDAAPCVGGIATTAVVAPAVLSGRQASAALPPLPNLPAGDALLLQPTDAHFADYQPAFNARTMLTPALRALPRTAAAVGTLVDWCRSNDLPFALRCGGHSYEGFSQSASVVIDARLIKAVTFDAHAMTATVGAGASLGDFYKVVAPHGLGFPGGSCPTVGVSGHVLGGGYGHLARPFGLACDSLLSIDLVDPQGHQIHADATQNADLFWACRGGGGGSFGVATGFRFQLHAVKTVFVFRIDWPTLAARPCRRRDEDPPASFLQLRAERPAVGHQQRISMIGPPCTARSIDLLAARAEINRATQEPAAA